MPIVVAFDALGVSHGAGYELVRTGAFPCRVLKLGRLLKVSRADLLALLGITDTPADVTNGGP